MEWLKSSIASWCGEEDRPESGRAMACSYHGRARCSGARNKRIKATNLISSTKLIKSKPHENNLSARHHTSYVIIMHEHTRSGLDVNEDRDVPVLHGRGLVGGVPGNMVKMIVAVASHCSSWNSERWWPEFIR
jgi:hypothetical protein